MQLWVSVYKSRFSSSGCRFGGFGMALGVSRWDVYSSGFRA